MGPQRQACVEVASVQKVHGTLKEVWTQGGGRLHSHKDFHFGARTRPPPCAENKSTAFIAVFLFSAHRMDAQKRKN